MSDTVTGLDLIRLEELAEKATPGEWWASEAIEDGYGEGFFIGVDRDDARDGFAVVVTTAGPVSFAIEPTNRGADAEFIAAMRNAVPSLLAAARAAEAVRLAVHLDDDDPINMREAEPRDNDDWQRAAYEDGWDAAVDHMRGLVRAALGTEQEGQQ